MERAIAMVLAMPLWRRWLAAIMVSMSLALAGVLVSDAMLLMKVPLVLTYLGGLWLAATVLQARR